MELATASPLEPVSRELSKDERFTDVAPDALVPLDRDGITHTHVEVQGAVIDDRPILLRIPKLSQWGMSPEQQLAYEATCFERAARSGVTPRYHGVLPVSHVLPRGALIVEYVQGRKPRLPKELPAIANCLARIHRLPLPPMGDRRPLTSHEDAFGETLKLIEEQAAYLGDAQLEPEALAQITQELSVLRAMRHEIRRLTPVTTFTGTDTHPGNFLIRDDGVAIYVDLEKVIYGSPAIDLAHTTLYTSTTWDPDCSASISEGETAAFHAIYLRGANRGFRARLEPWIMPMRRLTWMRTITWCARWRVISRQRGTDWDAFRLPPRYRDHVERRTEHFLSKDIVSQVRAEWRQ